MRRVIVESPFAPRTPMPVGECENALGCNRCFRAREQREAEYVLHARYLAACLRDCVLRGESPYASHRMLTMEGVLRDDVPEERALGIKAGLFWREVAHVSAFYVDLGWSGGMRYGDHDAQRLFNDQSRHGILPIPAHEISIRVLGGEWESIGRALRAEHVR